MSVIVIEGFEGGLKRWPGWKRRCYLNVEQTCWGDLLGRLSACGRDCADSWRDEAETAKTRGFDFNSPRGDLASG